MINQTIGSIINNKKAAETLINEIVKVAPKGTEDIWIGNVIVRLQINGFIVIEELKGLESLGLELEAIEAKGRDQLSVTFERRIRG